MKENVHSFKVGEFTCYWVWDGHNLYPPRAVLAGAPEKEMAGLFPPGEFVAIPYAALLVDTGAFRILIDTGAGPLAPTAGGAANNPRAAGLAPETVDLVVFSHAHPDHIGGTVGETGEVIFPNARFLMFRAEFDYWTDQAIQAKLSANELYRSRFDPAIGDWIRRYPPLIQNRLELLERDAGVAPGVQVIPAPGHTPGRLAVMISAGRRQLLYVGDAFVRPAQIGRPEWSSMFETDPHRAGETRRRGSVSTGRNPSPRGWPRGPSRKRLQAGG
jgi:glyoxylase-like metal-dependent hydrolase (beta-lactamase superfamily II)